MRADEPLPRRDERQEAPTASGPWDLLAQVAWYLFRCTTSTAVAVRTVFLFLGLGMSLGVLVLIAGLQLDGLPDAVGGALGSMSAIAGSGLTVVAAGAGLHATRTALRRRRVRADAQSPEVSLVQPPTPESGPRKKGGTRKAA